MIFNDLCLRVPVGLYRFINDQMLSVDQFPTEELMLSYKTLARPIKPAMLHSNIAVQPYTGTELESFGWGAKANFKSQN